MDERKNKFLIFEGYKLIKGDISLSIGITSKGFYDYRETYLYLNLFKWNICIGFRIKRRVKIKGKGEKC